MLTIYICYDPNTNEIHSWGSTPFPENNAEVTVEENHEILFLPMNYSYIDGKLVRNNDLVLEREKERKINELNDSCNEAILEGFSHNGDFFQFNYRDQDNFNQQLTLMMIDESIDNIYWKTENNGIKVFTRQQFIDICKMGEAHKRSNIERYWILKNYILTYDFKSVDEVRSVDFNTSISE